MKVKDLIAALQQLDRDMVVCTMDQSGAMCSVTKPGVVKMWHYYDLSDEPPRALHYVPFVVL